MNADLYHIETILNHAEAPGPAQSLALTAREVLVAWLQTQHPPEYVEALLEVCDLRLRRLRLLPLLPAIDEVYRLTLPDGTTMHQAVGNIRRAAGGC